LAAGNGAGATLANISLGSVARPFDIGDSTNAAADLKVTGAVTGVVPLTKTGAGTLELDGPVAGSASVVAGELGGSGNIAGAVDIQAAGALGAGGKGSIGIFATGPETFAANATLALDINFVARTSDLINITGNLTLDSGNTTKLVLNDLNQIGQFTFFALPILTYSGSWNNALFTVNSVPIDDYDPANPGASTQFFVGQNRYALDYNYNNTHTVALISVPEPGSLALLAGGVALLGGMRRRRR
jgi:hypothetical protein